MKLRKLPRFTWGTVLAAVFMVTLCGCAGEEPDTIPVSQKVLNQQFVAQDEFLKQYELPADVDHSSLNTLSDLRKYVHFGAVGGRFFQIWQIWLADGEEPYYSRREGVGCLPISADGHKMTVRALYDNEYHVEEIHKVVGTRCQTYHKFEGLHGMMCEETAPNTFRFTFEENHTDQPISWIVCLRGTGVFEYFCHSHECFELYHDKACIKFLQMPNKADADFLTYPEPPFFFSSPEYEKYCIIMEHWVNGCQLQVL